MYCLLLLSATCDLATESITVADARDFPAYAGVELIGLIVFFLMLLSKVISAVMAQAQQPPAPGPRPSHAADLGEEVRKFLERTALKQQEKAEQAATVRPPLSNMPGIRSTTATMPTDIPLDAELIMEDEIRRGTSVSEHVKRHLGGEHLPHQVSSLVSADENMESHLHQVFDHRLGDLSRAQPTPIEEGTDLRVFESPEEKGAGSSPTRAREIVNMLRQPSQLRQAVILSEILRRREDLL